MLSEGSIGKALEGDGGIRRVAPFVAVVVVALAAVILLGASPEGQVLVAGLLVLPLVASAYLVPWWRLPAWAQAAPLLLFFAIVALLRDAAGADSSIFTALVILPVFWFALYGTRAQLIASLVGLYLTLAAPVLVVGAPDYPPRDELVRACLWLMIGGAVGIAVNRLVQEVRAHAITYRSIIETAHESFISVDAKGRIVEWNRQAERDFGWSRDEVIGRELVETVIPPRHRDDHLADFNRLLRTGKHRVLGRRLELPVLHRDGHEFPVEMTISALRLGDGYRFNAFLHDVSERHEIDRALRDAEERFRRAFDDAAVGMAIVSPEGEWLQVNQALADLTGYPKDELAGMSFDEITHPDDLDGDPESLRRLIGRERRRYVTEQRYFHADGHVIWISLNVSAVHDENGGVPYLISQMQDITERREAEAKLSHQAMHDPLTGLPNRTLFNDRILLAKARLRRGGSLGLLFLDLDHFKSVNDSLGHDTGDRLLIEVSRRLRSVLRPSDTVSRFGGDEFALLCEGVDAESADAIAGRIDEAFSTPFLIDGHEVSLSASTGIVLSGDPDFDPGRLMSDADIAMYVAKEGGRARHVLFRHEMRGRRSAFTPGDGRPSPAPAPVGPSARS